MPESVQCEVWVMVDESGDYVVAVQESDLADRYAEDIQDIGSAGGLRRIKIVVTVPLPETVELAGVVPVQGEASLTVVS